MNQKLKWIKDFILFLIVNKKEVIEAYEEVKDLVELIVDYINEKKNER